MVHLIVHGVGRLKEINDLLALITCPEMLKYDSKIALRYMLW